ncbi:uncharacterized protein LOC133805647 [Humulus lupulus]|uniref:uncharacterized protein LOC133805647 n=1 Tax=Humulus lupulus TaxID=3486 RepID=UPI002B401DF6|nr:uncharacterized protein LOC133805647 [Humulus lupulus]
MSTLFWNYRGLGTPWTTQFLQELVLRKRPNFIFLCEILCKQVKVDRLKRLLGFEGLVVVDSRGHSGGLAFIWRKQEEAQLLSFSQNHIDMLLSPKDSATYRVSGFYGEPDRSKRHITWDLMRTLTQQSSYPWCILGDMNNILRPNEKRGGRPYPRWLIDGFSQAIWDCGLVDLELSGYPYTWERGRGSENWVEVRLDRALASSSWLNLFPNFILLNTEVSTSDHCPLLLDPSPIQHFQRIKSFRFENAWLREPMCKLIVEDTWAMNVGGSIFEKLDACSKTLEVWGNDITGNFFRRIGLCRERLRSLKGRNDPTSLRQYHEASTNLFEALTQKEVFWKQRSKQVWLREGDQNSKYFHASARARRRSNRIISLCNEQGMSIGWADGLQDLIVDYFQHLFTPSASDWGPVVDILTPRLSVEQNATLLASVDEDEVKAALFQMHPDKSPGPDGMSPGFYQKFWNILGHDVVKQVQEIWRLGRLDDKLSLTNIVLIPKKKSPKTMLDLRPISLCNVLYKVASKVLANRLKQVIDRIISETQSAFIPGRLITDNVMISYEIMHYLKRKRQGKDGFMAIKLDMSKAYDRVEWGYLQAVLGRLGFDEKLVAMIMACVSSVRYQICHGGRVFGNITPGRGLRQGDPLSPYLFIICTEGFSALLQRYERLRFLSGVQVARGAPKISHMFFADDSYIFCKAKFEEASHVLDLLHSFEQASGQKVNFEKSSIFFSHNTDVSVRDMICGEMGIHEADEESTYLGLPNIMGRKKSVLLGYLKSRIQQRIERWEGRFLSKAGKEILLKNVAQALPNYAMSVFLLPLELSRDLERRMCKYWWQSSSSKKGIHWLSWKRLCTPKALGGLGFRDFRQFNIALLGKQAWRLVKFPHSLVSRVYQTRYYPHSTFFSAKLGGSPSFIWRSILEAQSLIQRGAGIRVGSGHSVMVTSDPWLPDSNNPFVTSDHVALEGKRVFQLMLADRNEWDVDLLRDLFPERDVDLIFNIPICRDDVDSWYWRYDNLGIYTVKSAYSLLQGSASDSETSANSGFWRRLWHLKIPPKAKNFLWQAAKECLPTRVQLQTRHVLVDPLCPFCQTEQETIGHVLVSCDFSGLCWRQAGLAISTMITGSFSEWLSAQFARFSGDQRADIAMICWALWHCRNQLVWQQKHLSPSDVLLLARTTLSQWVGAQDRAVNLSLGLLIPTDGAVKWSLPKEGFMKINTDAGLFESLNCFSFSCVARDHRGLFCEARVSCRRGMVSPEVAEVLGIKEALSWVKNANWDHVEIESDSMVAVQAIRSSVDMCSYFGRLVRECRQFLIDLKPKDVSVTFIRRSANALAHCLAKATSIVSDRVLEVFDTSVDFQTLLLNDLI